jgi:ribonuclease P protein component
MLPSKHRLALRKELKRVQTSGRLFQGKFFSLLTAGNKLDYSRFGLIVSAKVAKKAVDRNRVRRLLIESIREFLLEVKPGFDVVFLTKKAIVSQKLPVIKKEVSLLFKKAGLTA